ncbi:MAG: 4-aminobutyrate aminotransferase [Anaerolinea thermophila]|uniref:(S)-3-amino-2-methylpropionate transaminase n=1 Tax=Anaerolinea thermophila TaxID=167964 RepID=A0A124FN73_9CHLR|nr:MAG: 4-aminobutyrate aminotransferase [Anaerolinea thermophila]
MRINPGPISESLIERDKKVISSSYPRGYPFVMDHGKGVEVWDADGRRYLDFAAGIAVNSTGHSHPEVVAAITEQAQKFIHISSDFYHEKWIQLAEKLDEISPFHLPAISFMANSGSEAVESALKLAKYYTERSQFIGFLGGFHGRTAGSLSMTASKLIYHRSFYPLMNGVTHVPFPNPYRPLLQMNAGENTADAVIRYMEEVVFHKLLPPTEVAGILIEPIQGEGGYIYPPDNFLPALRQLCDKYGILLIADEVQSGMGRTGKWWAIDHYGVEPDILCIAKGIASGVPMGVMMAKAELMPWPSGSHGNTFGGNPLACAAALKTIELIETQYLENAQKMGKIALEMLQDMQNDHPSIGDVRGKGLMIGVEFVKDRQTKEPAVDLRNEVVDQCFSKGLLTLGCGDSTIRITPPLCITEQEIREGLEIFSAAIKEAESHL